MAVINVLSELKNIQETIYLYSIPGMVESILEADNEDLSKCSKYDPNEEW